MKVRGKTVRQNLTEDDILVNLMECAVYLSERDDDNNVIELEVMGGIIRFQIDLSHFREE